jgi:hypothetical protein
VSALSDENVGKYMNRHFVSSFQKVAAFQINGDQKNGGNVAGYFCSPEGFVLHAVAGPVDANVFLREARWANETLNLAVMENHKTVSQMQTFFRKAHLARLQNEYGIHLPASRLPAQTNATPHSLGKLLDQNIGLRLNNQGKVHLLLAVAPLPRIDQVYQVVFEKILNERVSTNPVAVVGR